MPSVWEQRFARFVRRVTAQREASSLELVPDLLPVAPVIEPSDLDLRSARGEMPVSGYYAQAAAPGFYNFQALVNGTENTLFVVEDVDLWGGAGGIQIGLMGGAVAIGAAHGQVAARDSRWIGAPIQAVWRQGTNAGPNIGQNSMWYSLGTMALATTLLGMPLRVVVSPGYTLVFMSGGANEQLRVGIRWRERVVDAAELAVP